MHGGLNVNKACFKLRFFSIRNLGVPLFDERFGAGTGAILLDNVNCRGNETSLADCEHGGWGQHNCAHTEDVSIMCVDSLDITGNKFMKYGFGYH